MMLLARRPDWAERLLECVDRHRANRFEWGRYDCATFFNDAVTAVADGYPLAAHMPWTSERSAAAALLRSGYRDVLHFVETHFPEISPAMAQRGDLGFVDNRHALTCPAVIVGVDAVTRSETSWLSFPATALVRTFKVG